MLLLSVSAIGSVSTLVLVIGGDFASGARALAGTMVVLLALLLV